jgi:hypothetical protein
VAHDDDNLSDRIGSVQRTAMADDDHLLLLDHDQQLLVHHLDFVDLVHHLDHHLDFVDLDFVDLDLDVVYDIDNLQHDDLDDGKAEDDGHERRDDDDQSVHETQGAGPLIWIAAFLGGLLMVAGALLLAYARRYPRTASD